MKEIWKDIEGYKDKYQVSDYGRIRTIKKRGKKLLIPYVKILSRHHSGYLIVGLFDNNNKNHILDVHRLVTLHFVSNPDNKPWVNHKDGKKENNHVENLEWSTISENLKHAHKFGLRKTWAEHNNAAKLDWLQVNKIRKLYKTGKYRYKDLSKKFNVSISNICYIIKDISWNRR